MREPRQNQRFPTNGKELYELLRRDYEPILLWVCVQDETEDRYIQPDTLIYDRVMDPMLYFWPVERQHVVVHLRDLPDDAAKKRLLDALLRDGARWVTVMWRIPSFGWEDFGDASGYLRDHYPPVDPVAVPGAGSGPD